MMPYQKSYWKTIYLAGMVALSIGGFSGFWLVRGAILLPLVSVSASAHPVLFWLSIVTGIVAARLSCAVALGGVLCSIRDHRETVGCSRVHHEPSKKETRRVL